MRFYTALFLVISATACATPRPLPRARLAPMLEIESVQIVNDRIRADRDQSAPLRVHVGEASQIDGRNTATPPVTYRTVVQTIEVSAPSATYADQEAPYDVYGAYLHDRAYRQDHRPSSFPVNTAIGAGVGAIIGHQSGHRGRGAWIGSGVGLLLDLNRWWD